MLDYFLAIVFISLFVLVILMYVSVFTSTFFGLGLGKIFDMCKYYKYVSYCSRSENSDIMAMMCRFNYVLDEPYQLTDNDSDMFIEIYKEYSMWLMEKYMKKDFRFSEYKTSYSLKKRKSSNIELFLSTYGADSNNILFFAHSFAYFAGGILDEKYFDIPITDKDHELFVLARAYLGALQMLSLVDANKYSQYLNKAKKSISTLKG